MNGKIDVHTHAVPKFFRDELRALEGSGVPVVDWNLGATEAMNTELGVATSILSLSAPGAEIKRDRDEARKVARDYNQWASTIKRDDPSHFGFFAAVPSLKDTQGCLTEIAYAFDHLDADGVCVFTSYGGTYFRDGVLDPIWDELNALKTVVFIHPIGPANYSLTGRTAAHMIMTGTKRRFADMKVILSHAGGTLPVLAERMAQLNATLFKDKLQPSSPNNAEEIMADAKSFYFNLALSGTHNILSLMLRWAPEKILYGGDFPYCTAEAEYNTKKLEEYAMSERMRALFTKETASNLFPRLR